MVKTPNDDSVVDIANREHEVTAFAKRVVTESRAAFLASSSKVFAGTTDIISVSGVAENDFMLIRNPLASGLAMRIVLVIFSLQPSTAGDSTIYRLYRNPTVTDTGIAITTSNTNIGGAASGIQLFSIPTISARGTLMTSHTDQFITLIQVDSLFILPEDNDILVTVQPSKGNLGHTVTLVYAEDTP